MLQLLEARRDPYIFSKMDHSLEKLALHDDLAGYEVSAWERGLKCIDSILQPGSATLDALSEEQRSGLQSLKAIMLSGDREENIVNFIPQALLDADTRSSTILMANYAGYTPPIDAMAAMSKVLLAHKGAMKLKKIARESLRSKSMVMEQIQKVTLPDAWNRLDIDSKLQLRDLLSWDNISKWDFNIFDVDKILKGENTLVFVSWAILASPDAQYSMDMACAEIFHEDIEVDSILEREGYNFVSSLQVNETTLIEFLKAIEKKYNSDVKYHNHVHAADVTQSLHAICQMGGQHFTQEKIELFAVFIASIVHDVGHNGLNNTYHINSRSDLALMYNDVSVLENMHVATVFKMLLGDSRERRLDIFENFVEEDTEKVRKLIIKAVLSTDMTKHFAKLNSIKGIIMGSDNVNKLITHDLPEDFNSRTDLLTFTMHMADISNPSKDIRIATKWTDRILEECFMQGDLEESTGLPISPLCDRHTTNRPRSQIGFINFIVLPSFELLGEVIPRVATEVVPRLRQNLKYWQELDILKSGKE